MKCIGIVACAVGSSQMQYSGQEVWSLGVECGVSPVLSHWPVRRLGVGIAGSLAMQGFMCCVVHGRGARALWDVPVCSIYKSSCSGVRRLQSWLQLQSQSEFAVASSWPTQACSCSTLADSLRGSS